MKSFLNSAVAALFLSVVAGALGLAWNHFNPQGITLTVVPPPPSADVAGEPESPEAAAARMPFSMAAKLPADEQISLQEAFALFEDGRVFFVDARSEAEFKATHIPGAHHIHEKDFIDQAPPLLPVLRSMLPPDRDQFPDGYPVVTYCGNHTCDLASIVLTKLKGLGIENVRCLVMGLDEWIRANRPVVVVENGEEVEKQGAELSPKKDPPIAGIPPHAWLAILILAPFIAIAVAHRVLPHDPMRAVAHVARIGLGLLFVVAAGFKLWDPADFAQMVACYDIVSATWLPTFAVTLPAIELVAGLLLAVGKLVRPSALIIDAMLVGFMFAIYSLLERSLSCSCGCFPVAYPASWVRIYEDAAFLFAGLLAWWSGRAVTG